jgi:hypothetical protein
MKLTFQRWATGNGQVEASGGKMKTLKRQPTQSAQSAVKSLKRQAEEGRFVPLVGRI